jgi:hypothetical protein
MYSKNYMKKIGSVALAGAMAASLAIPAFAANQTTLTGTYSEPEIAVTVPDTGTIAINPYGLPVTFDTSDGTVSVKNQQITTAPLNIRNEGNLSDLDAYVTVTSKASSGSGVKFYDVSWDATKITDKSIHLTLEGKASTLAGYSIDDDVEDKLITEFADQTIWTAGSGYYKIELDANGAVTARTQIATLKALDTDGKYQAGSIAQIRLTGKLAEDPKDSAWSTKDGFTTTIAFTFKPSADTNATA